MAEYRKKPVVVEAVQYHKAEHYQKLQEWGLCWEMVHDTQVVRVPHIHTLEGIHHVREDDWVIKGIKGEFYPCKPDVFEATYELVEE